MLSSILFFAVAFLLDAPAWFFVLCGVFAIVKAINFGIAMYKAGKGK